MKIRQVVDAFPALQKLAGQDLTIKKLYKISKLLSNLENEIAFFDAQKSKLLAQYCDIVDNQYVPRQETEAELNQKFNELLDTDIDDVQEVMISDSEDVKLSYNDLVLLRGFVGIEDID